MTPEQINQNIEAIRQQGGTEQDIKEYQDSVSATVSETEPRSFGERFKSSFGSPDVIEQAKQREAQEGLRGKFDIGDIADIAGTALGPVGLGIAGGALGGLPGAAIGTGLGELAKEAVGQAFGVNEMGIYEPAKAGVQAYLGGKLFAGVGGYVMSRIPKMLGVITKQNPDEIVAVLNNPKVADIGIQQGDTALRNIVTVGAKESFRIRNDFVKGQRIGVNKITEQYDKALATSKELFNAFKAAVNREGIRIVNGKLKYPAEFLADPRNNARRISQVFQMLKQKQPLNLTNLNSIKQTVGEAAGFVEREGRSKVPVLGNLYHELDDIIRTRLPSNLSSQYSQLNKVFSENIRIYNEIVKAFNATDPFTKLAGVFSENADKLRGLLQFYEQKTGKSILPQIAGRKIAGERVAGSSFLNPQEWLDALISPKAQAEFVSLVGKTKPFVKPVKKVLEKTIPPLIPSIFD